MRGQVRKFQAENTSWKQVLASSKTYVCRTIGNTHRTAYRAVDFSHLLVRPAETLGGLLVPTAHQAPLPPLTSTDPQFFFFFFEDTE